MARNNDRKTNKALDRKKQKAARLYRALILVAFALVQLPVLMWLDYDMLFTVSAMPTLKILSAAFFAAGAAMIVWHVLIRKKHKPGAFGPADAAVMLFELAVVCICVGTYAFFAISVLRWVLPAFGLCCWIYCYGPRDLFIAGVFCSVTAADLHLLTQATAFPSDQPLRVVAYLLALFAALVAVAVLAVLIFLPGKRKLGPVSFGRATFVTEGGSHIPLAAALGAAIATLTASVVFRRMTLSFAPRVSQYMMYGMIGVWVVLALGYILKLNVTQE